jgi:hypothetical protein
LVYQNNEMAAILVYGTGISSFLFKYFVLFHHPTGATDHVSENDLYDTNNVGKIMHLFHSSVVINQKLMIDRNILALLRTMKRKTNVPK